MCLQESNEVHLSALGVAMSSLVTVAEILKARQLVVVKSLCTMLELFDDRSPKPKVRGEIACKCTGSWAFNSWKLSWRRVSSLIPSSPRTSIGK